MIYGVSTAIHAIKCAIHAMGIAIRDSACKIKKESGRWGLAYRDIGRIDN